MPELANVTTLGKITLAVGPRSYDQSRRTGSRKGVGDAEGFC
jgi:hypothetical protein